MHDYTDKSDSFIITAPTYKILYQATIPCFMKYMENYGRHNKKEEVFEMRNGGRAYFRTERDPDSVVGITNARHIWEDEAGKYRLYFHENLEARAAMKDCPITFTTSPYSLNWIYKDFIKPINHGKRKDSLLVQAASWENPYHSLHDPHKRELKRSAVDPRRFNMIFGGKWDRMEGLVYDCFCETENQCKPFQLPTNTRVVGGIDWGFEHPFVIKIRAITPDGYHFGLAEFYKTRVSLTDQVKVAKYLKTTWNVELFYADPSEPGMIDEFNSRDIPTIGAKNDIRLGIDLHYELLKSRKLQYFEGANPHTLDEYEMYHYPEPKDVLPDQDEKEPLPVDQNNHAMDVERYITIETYGMEKQKGPHVPQVPGRNQHETYEQRMKRLLKRKDNSQTEEWG